MIKLIALYKCTITSIEINICNSTIVSNKCFISTNPNLKFWCEIMINLIIWHAIFWIEPFNINLSQSKCFWITIINIEPFSEFILVLYVFVEIGITCSIHISVCVCWEVKNTSFSCTNPTSKCSISQNSISNWGFLDLNSEYVVPCCLSCGFPSIPTTNSVF